MHKCGEIISRAYGCVFSNFLIIAVRMYSVFDNSDSEIVWQLEFVKWSPKYYSAVPICSQ